MSSLLHGDDQTSSATSPVRPWYCALLHERLGPLVPDWENPDASELGGTTKIRELWGFKSVGGLEPNAYTHALFADFDLAGQK
jgi:hypothetical protein